MKQFVCSHCKEVEIVSQDATVVVHAHGDNYFQLMAVQGGPVGDKERNTEIFIKEVHSIPFDPNKIYMVLFNPVDIDIVQVMKNIDNNGLRKLHRDVLFVPCRFSQDTQGYSTEMIAIESLDIIEEWLKERKAALCTT